MVSPSDPEAALGRDKEGVFRPLYNVQAADDLDSPLILAYEVFAQPNDAGLLGPMLARLREALGRPLRTLLADSAYAGGADLAAAAAAGVTVYAPSPPATGGDRRRPAADSQRRVPVVVGRTGVSLSPRPAADLCRRVAAKAFESRDDLVAVVPLCDGTLPSLPVAVALYAALAARTNDQPQ